MKNKVPFSITLFFLCVLTLQGYCSSVNFITQESYQAMKRQICYYGNPVLRKNCAPVEEITDEIRQLVSDMIETMDALNGVGLAANQIGESLQIFIIRPVTMNENKEVVLGDVEVYINPRLSNPSEQTEIYTEGCLSFPSLFVDIERPYSIHVEATDLEGNTFSKDLTGFIAREIMHENDHLHGRLFIDRIKDEQVLNDIQPMLKNIESKNTSIL